MKFFQIVLASWLMGMSPTAVFAAQKTLPLLFPVDCQIGKTCWIPNYVDLKPGNGVLDYACGTASYDARPSGQHKGTDIAVRDMASVRKGIRVFAAADGDVIGVRDGVKDINIKDRPKPIPSTKACGNGVRLKHKGGFITQYCHMRKGSIRVQNGAHIRRGDVLGFVGLSGKTAFPHVHFQVNKDGRILDPFAGLDRKRKCGVGSRPLWDRAIIKQIPYEPTAIYNVGFSFQKPNFKDITKGLYKATHADVNVPALVVWAEFFRVKAADKIVISIIDPFGNIIHNTTISIKSDKAKYTAFSGLRLKAKRWQTGLYTGKVKLVRLNKTFVAMENMEIIDISRVEK